MRDMAQLRLQVLLLLLIWLLPTAHWQVLTPPAAAPLLPWGPPLCPDYSLPGLPDHLPEAHSSQGLAVWLLSLLPLFLLFLFTLTLVSVYFSSKVIGRRGPLSLGQQEKPYKSPLRTIFPLPGCGAHTAPLTMPSLTSSRSLSWKGAYSSPRPSQQCHPTSSLTPRPSATTSPSSASWPPVAASLSSSQGQVSILGRWEDR